MTVSFVTLGIDISYQIFRNLTFPLTATSDCSGDLGGLPLTHGLRPERFLHLQILKLNYLWE